MQNFSSLDLPEVIFESLAKMQFHIPTPIQMQAIPSALLGNDILGSAQTGTGKTAAFGIPLIAHLIKNPNSSGLVLAPTRELALQILNTLKQILGHKTNINTVLIIGGESITAQIAKLRTKPRLIVGTPGRIHDLLNRRALQLNNTKFMVLDEIDRMLDMGFSVDLQKIVKFLPEERQTLMFSATVSPAIVKVAYTYSKEPLRITVGSTTIPTEKIKQELIKVSNENEKYSSLLTHLDTLTGLLIIFVKTKMATENLAVKLSNHGHQVGVIHGDLKQRTRTQAIRDFRNRKNRILVATDIVARGLDVPNIECVINYDLPQCPEDYIHRIGRTGRAGTEGIAINLLTAADSIKWRNICKMMNPKEKFEGTNPLEQRSNPKSNRRREFRAGDNRFGNRSYSGNGESRGGDSRFSSKGSRDARGGNRELRENKMGVKGLGFSNFNRPKKPLSKKAY